MSSPSLIIFPKTHSYSSFPMVVSGVLRLYGEELLNQQVVIIWGSFLMSNRFRIPHTTRAGGEKSAEQRTWARQALYLSYLVWIFPSEHPAKEGVIVPILQ